MRVSYCMICKLFYKLLICSKIIFMFYGGLLNFLHHKPMVMEEEHFKLLLKDPDRALKEIIKQHGAQLKRRIELTIGKDEVLVKDVINETLICLYVKREEVVCLDKPSAWMMIVAGNIALSLRRGEHSALKIAIDDLLLDPSDSVWADTELCYKELHERFMKATEQLTPRERDMVIDAKLHGKDNDELSRIHGVSLQHAKNLLSSGLKKIRHILRDI